MCNRLIQRLHLFVLSISAMATGGNGVDEVAQEAGTSDGTVDVARKASQGDTREDQGAGQVGNQNESGCLMELFEIAASHARLLWRRPVSQFSYIDEDPNATSSEVIYRSVIERRSVNPYRFKFQDPTYIITGIACIPRDNKTSSPEAEVISGGVGFKKVEILLKPVEKGDWCCCVQINGIAENHEPIF